MEEIFNGKNGLILLLGGIILSAAVLFVFISIKHILLIRKLNNGKNRIYTSVEESDIIDKTTKKTLLKYLKLKEQKFSLLMSKYLQTHSDIDEIKLINCYNSMVEIRKLLSNNYNHKSLLKEGSLDIICKNMHDNNCNSKIKHIHKILQEVDKQLTNKR